MAEYEEYETKFKNKFAKLFRKDRKGLIASKIDTIKQLRNAIVDIEINDSNRQQILEDIYAISRLNYQLNQDYKRYKDKGDTDQVSIYENAGIKKVSLWGGGNNREKFGKVVKASDEVLTEVLSTTSPKSKVNKYFKGMTEIGVATSSTVITESTDPMLERSSSLGSTLSMSSTEEEDEEEVEAPKDIVEGDEGVVSVKTELDIPATIDEDAVYVSETTVSEPIGEETPSDTLPTTITEEEPAESPPLPTATEDAVPTAIESDPVLTPLVEGLPTDTGGTTPTIPPSDSQPVIGESTQEFELDAGTRTQPTIEGVLGSIDRGVLSSLSVSRREGLSINKLKEDIKDFHKIYNNVIPAFRDKSHQKRKEKALKSKNKREVLQHYEEIENLIANYYKNDGGFKLGVIVSAESLFSGNVFGGSDLFGTGMVGANSGVTPIDRNSLERGGSTKYNKVVDIEPTYTRGGIDHALQKPVQNKEPKVKKGRVRFDRNINTIPVAVHRPYNHILNRPLKPSYNIKIKGKK